MSFFGPPNVEKMKAKKDVSGLIKALSYTKDASVREAAAHALGEIGDPRAVEPLIVVLNDNDWEKRFENRPVRFAAASALGRIGDSRAVRPLAEALNEYVLGLDGPASDALIEIGDPSAVQPVIAVMMSIGNKDNSIRVLCAIGKPAVEPVTTLLEDKRSRVRQTAAYVLGEIGDRRAVDPLVQTLKDRAEHVRTRAAKALGQIGDARAVDPLIIALQDEWADMRKAAAEALGKIGTPKAKEALVARGYGQQGSTDKKRSQPAPKLPAGLPGPMPKHEFVSSSNLKEGPGSGGSEFQTALGHWNASRYDQAVEHYVKAIELGLTSVYEAASRSNLGKIFLMQENVEAAVDQFLKGLYLSPLTASTAYSCSSHLALIYEELGMTDDMLATVEVAEVALKQIGSIMSAEAANKVRATVRRVYK